MEQSLSLDLQGWLENMPMWNKSGNGSDTNLFMDLDLMKEVQHMQMSIAAEFMDGLFTHKTPFALVLMTLYGIVFTIGLVGNSLVIMVMIKHRHMRTITNMFLVNLSIGDLLVVVVCMPFSLAPYVYKVHVYYRFIAIFSSN